MDIPFDLHSHCTLSFDGISTAEDMIKQAVKLGIKYYALTDHVDLGDHPDPEFDLGATVNGAKELIPPLQEKYADRVELLYGVELGQPTHEPELAGKLLRENDYDFVIGSIHNIRGHDDFYFLDYNVIDPVKLLDAYFEELLEMARWGKFDIMAHITYPLRYIVGDCGIDIDMTRYDAVIDDIFRELINNGRGIEINTSGLRQKIGRMLPDVGYVTRYRQLGGKILTIGSDAHCADDLGKGIADGIAAAREAGFTEIAVFRKRKPLFIGI